MKINLYDENLNRTAIIGESFISCLWSEAYNSTQPFSLELNATEEMKKKVRPECYIGREDRKTLMVIKTVRTRKDTLVCTGFTADRVLDDVAFIGTIRENAYIDTAVANAYNNSDKYPHVEYANTDLRVSAKSQNSNKSFLKLSQKLCQESDLGFRVVRSGKTVLAEFYNPGENVNAVFAEKYGNLSLDEVIMSSTEEKNYAIVLGEGYGAERTMQIVDLSFGQTKKQLVVDARDLQKEEGETDEEYNNRLYMRGVEKLTEYQKISSIVMSVSSVAFFKTFDLGDIVTVLLPDYNTKLHARIMRFEQKEQKNKTETKITVGNIIIQR